MKSRIRPYAIFVGASLLAWVVLGIAAFAISSEFGPEKRRLVLLDSVAGLVDSGRQDLASAAISVGIQTGADLNAMFNALVLTALACAALVTILTVVLQLRGATPRRRLQVVGLVGVVGALLVGGINEAVYELLLDRPHSADALSVLPFASRGAAAPRAWLAASMGFSVLHTLLVLVLAHRWLRSQPATETQSAVVG